MLQKFNKSTSRYSPPIIGLFTLAQVAFLGFVDHVTGYEISFSVFYLLPIAIAAWYNGRLWGLFISIASAGAWGLVEYLADLPFSEPWILYWNSFVRLGFFLIVAWLLAELKVNLRRQQHLARTDTLTGLLNRPGFLEHATAMVALAERHNHATTIGFADLDGFKRVNDTLGHAQGDNVLQLVASLLEGLGRGSDISARFGGDEFAILLPETGLAGAQNFFEKFHRLAEDELHQRGFTTIGVSIGAIVFEDGPPDLSEALRLADDLMYRAKEPGSGGVVIETAVCPKAG